MNNLKKAFTIIELLIVMFIIIVVSAMLLNSFRGAVESSMRASCMSNISNIVKAMHLYIEDYDGANLPPYSNVNRIYGALYYTSDYCPGASGGITNADIYVCPARKVKPGKFQGYGQYIITDQTNTMGYKTFINYEIIKEESKPSSIPDFTTMPSINAVIWEADYPNHKTGRHLGFWNQTVKFISGDSPVNYPTNLNHDTGLPENNDIYTLCAIGIGTTTPVKFVIGVNDNP